MASPECRTHSYLEGAWRRGGHIGGCKAWEIPKGTERGWRGPHRKLLPLGPSRRSWPAGLEPRPTLDVSPVDHGPQGPHTSPRPERSHAPQSALEPAVSLTRHYLGAPSVRPPARPWQCLYLTPDPHGQRSLRPVLARISAGRGDNFVAASTLHSRTSSSCSNPRR